jgi:hypothetical protein
MAVSPSVFGRLLEEISWEGNARHYRTGGQGYENVLTAEVLQALDFLPRAGFFARILESVAGAGAASAVRTLTNEAEGTRFSLLPGGVFLETTPSVKSPVEVQPDAVRFNRLAGRRAPRMGGSAARRRSGGLSAAKSRFVRDIQNGYLESPVWRPTVESSALHSR